MEINQTMKYIIAAIVVAIIGFIAFKLVVTNDMGPVENTDNNPVTVSHADWETSSVGGTSFQYPETTGTKYMHEQDWPPVLLVENEKFSCSNAGAETETAGVSETKTINGHVYCVTRESDGAAGSTYTQYAYARAAESKTEIMTFTLRMVNCGNYDELEKNECEAERASFDIDKLVDEMFATVTASSTPADVSDEMCYIWNTEAGDSATLRFALNENDVSGSFKWLPAEKDSKTGNFSGQLAGTDGGMKVIDAIWNTSAEGMTAKEEMKIKFSDTMAGVGFGEMREGSGGVYEYANPNDLSYEPNLSRTDCSDEAVK